MAAPKKNEFWKVRSKHGRDKIFSTPKILLEACNEYFQWVLDNPLYERIIQNSKEWDVPKMRAMTIEGLCIFLDVNTDSFYQYAKYEGFSEIITRVREIIRTQKFEGAAAGFLNQNIIARDLGLKEHTESEVKTSATIHNMPNDELIEKINEINERLKK